MMLSKMLDENSWRRPSLDQLQVGWPMGEGGRGVVVGA